MNLYGVMYAVRAALPGMIEADWGRIVTVISDKDSGATDVPSHQPEKDLADGKIDAVLIDALYGGKAEQFIETMVKFEDGRTGSVSATLRIDDAKTFAPVKAAA